MNPLEINDFILEVLVNEFGPPKENPLTYAERGICVIDSDCIGYTHKDVIIVMDEAQ